MTSRCISTLLAGALFVAAGYTTHAQAPAQAQAAQNRPWRTLLSAQSMEQWVSEGFANWRIVDDTVKADGGTGYLVSREAFGDFELRAEFYASPDANSGIFIRCSDPQVITAANSYEVNIFDTRPDPTYATGGIVNVAKVTSKVESGGKWNVMEITARGPRMTVRVNGTVISEGEDAKFARGPIALQRGAGEIRFRKVEIR